MNKKNNYIILSLILPLLFFIVTFSPEELLGCYTRGLTAVIISTLSALIGMGIVIKGLIKRIAGDKSMLLIVCGLILSTPAMYVVTIA